MSEIQEIPLDNTEENTNMEEIPEEIQETTETIEEIPQEIAPVPKKRGRPVGAKNKAKPKPKVVQAKSRVKPVAKRKEVQYEDSYSEEEEDYQPRGRGSMYAQQPVYDSHSIASEVLTILQSQRHNAKNARRSQYAQWVAQM